jgi:hypothetical protein
LLDESFVVALKAAGANIVLHAWSPDADSIHKALGEAQCTLAAIPTLRQESGFELVLKLSARYWLTDNFRLDRFSKDRFTFWRDPQQTMVRTVLYAVGKPCMDSWETALREIGKARSPAGYETQMHNLLHSKAEFTPVLGVAGYVSVDGFFFDG